MFDVNLAGPERRDVRPQLQPATPDRLLLHDTERRSTGAVSSSRSWAISLSGAAPLRVNIWLRMALHWRTNLGVTLHLDDGGRLASITSNSPNLSGRRRDDFLPKSPLEELGRQHIATYQPEPAIEAETHRDPRRRNPTRAHTHQTQSRQNQAVARDPNPAKLGASTATAWRRASTPAHIASSTRYRRSGSRVSASMRAARAHRLWRHLRQPVARALR